MPWRRLPKSETQNLEFEFESSEVYEREGLDLKAVTKAPHPPAQRQGPQMKCFARCPNPRAGREKASKTMQLAKKGKFITDSSQGSCCIQHSGAGSESPEPKLLPKFIGWT